jgi:hypothetical protein
MATSQDGRLRIGINAIALLSSLTGVGQYTRSLIQELAKRDDFDLHFFYARSWSRRMQTSPLTGIETWKSLIKRLVPEPYLMSRAAQQVIFSAGAKMRRVQLYHDPNFLAYRFDGPTVITVHDLSWVRYPQTHPAERVAALNRFFPRSPTGWIPAASQPFPWPHGRPSTCAAKKNAATCWPGRAWAGAATSSASARWNRARTSS